MGEVIQLQGDQRKDVQEFLTDKKEGLELDAKTIKVCPPFFSVLTQCLTSVRSMVSNPVTMPCSGPFFQSMLPCERWDREHVTCLLTAGRAHAGPSNGQIPAFCLHHSVPGVLDLGYRRPDTLPFLFSAVASA